LGLIYRIKLQQAQTITSLTERLKVPGLLHLYTSRSGDKCNQWNSL